MRHSEFLWHIMKKDKEVNLSCKWDIEERRGRGENGTNIDGIKTKWQSCGESLLPTPERDITHKRKCLTQSPYRLWYLSPDPSRRMEEDGKLAPRNHLLRCRWIARAQEGSLSRLSTTSATLRLYPNPEKSMEISPDRKPGWDSERGIAANTDNFV